MNYFNAKVAERRPGKLENRDILGDFTLAGAGEGRYLSVITPEHMLRKPLPSWLAFLPHLFRSFWTFFPGIFFILLTLAAFWLLGPGSDTLTAYVEQKRHALVLRERLFRLVFYLAIALWVYVTWYTSRIIADIKGKLQKVILVPGTDSGISSGFLEGIPRLAGHACFLVIELALWPILWFPQLEHVKTIAFVVLVAGLVIFYFLEKWALKRSYRTVDARGQEVTPFLTAFRVVGVLTVMAIAVSIFTNCSTSWSLVLSLVALCLLHALYFLYINLRRVRIRRLKAPQPEAPRKRDPLGSVMYFLCISTEERSWFGWFLGFMAVGLVIEILGFSLLPWAQHITPFPIVLLGFSMLLAAINLIAALSIRYRLNFHLVIFLLAITLTGRYDNHRVHAMDAPATPIDTARPILDTYLRAWLNTHVPSGKDKYDVYFVMSNGGASRSGYWTATVLGALEDASITSGDTAARFSRHLFCLSGASGGAVGVTAFFAALRNKQAPNGYCATESAFLSQDFFSYTAARLLGPDYFHYIIPIYWYPDRARALEQSLEAAGNDTTVPIADGLESFKALDHGQPVLPLLFINTTRMNDGTPGVVSNLKISRSYFNGRIDVDSLLDANNLPVSLATAAILGSRFPYISPAGRIDNEYFVDGGYFDNSGAGVVQELIQGIQDIAATHKDDTIAKQIARLRYNIIHIVNSPGSSDALHKIGPFVNDLFAPVLTVVGTYDVQTTVNDSRLYHYLSELNISDPDKTRVNEISLYLQKGDPGYDSSHPEPPYPMNWFMSETLRNRMDIRRRTDSTLLRLMAQYPKKQ